MSDPSISSPLNAMASPETITNGGPHESSATPPSEPTSTTQQRQTSISGSSALNARSCVTCRKRKVKCDKRHPCSNCNKAAIECIFPGPGRAPRRSRKPPDTELLARLRRLEGVVQTLGKGVDEEIEPRAESTPSGVEQLSQAAQEPVKDEGSGEPHTQEGCKKMMRIHEPGTIDKHENSMIKEFGKLVVNKRRSRYVSNTFWTSLSDEVKELQDVLDDSNEEDEEDYPSPGSGEPTMGNTPGFIFGFNSTVLSLRNYHPPPNQIKIYWEIYKTNVDPVLKVLHIPHAESLILAAANDLEHVSRPFEAMMFSTYFAVVTTLSDDECLMRLGIDRAAALRKYRFATEQALARANFINTHDILVLIAMVVFLTAVRRTDDSRFVWTMTGLLIRLAISLGVHRDGAQFKLPVFSIEMRRRLWWQICVLDVRTAEDQGCEPSIHEQDFDTKFPLNINDSQFDLTTKETPQEQEGVTDLTFDLIRFSVSTTLRRLSYTPPGAGPCKEKNKHNTLERKEAMIEELHQYIESKFLRHLDTSIPLQWVSATVARLIMAKIWLLVHHPLTQADGGRTLSEDTKRRLFQTSVEVVDFSRLLQTEAATRRWSWLFRTYVQWHALAFVLGELCVRTEGAEVDRAWMVVEEVFNSWAHEMTTSRRGMMWKPLHKLIARARAVRMQAIQQRALFPLDGRLGPSITPLITQPGPMMNGSSTGDYFANPPESASLSPEEFQAFEPDIANMPDFSNVSSFVNPGEISAFAHAGSQQQQQQQQTPLAPTSNSVDPSNDILKMDQSTDTLNPNLNRNNNISSSTNGTTTTTNTNDIPTFNNEDINAYNWSTTNGNPAYQSRPGGTIDGLPNDTVMGYADADGWDDLVREFNMDGASGQGGGMAWGGLEI